MPYGATRTKPKVPVLNEFQERLIGTWESTPDDPELTEERDGKRKPLSFNVMPLPQAEKQPHKPKAKAGARHGGFILKNFAFTERIRFNGTAGKKDPAELQDPEAIAVVAGAPNRGGSYTQIAHAVFYEQQVHFAEGPEEGKLVHIENGAWLHLGSGEQNAGPYGPEKIKDGQVQRQPPYLTVAKQIAVPHGNTVLALGSVDLNDGDDFKQDRGGLDVNTVLPGAPVIPDQFVPYPQPAEAPRTPYPEPPGIADPDFYDPYSHLLKDDKDFENPDVAWTLNPNRPLQLALDKIQPVEHMHWRVTTLPLFGGDSQVTNIPFEERLSDVEEYWADYWLLAKKPGKFEYLAYNQTVLMRMRVSFDEGETYESYVFPHITSSVVRKLPGTPTEAREAKQTPLQ